MLDGSCTFITGNSYCIEQNWGASPDPTQDPVTSSSGDLTPTSPGNGVTTPTPTQPGMADDCNDFDFVEPGDGCQAVTDRNGISLVDFLSWNPKVGSDCLGLWANVYVCVGVIGGSGPSTTDNPTPTPTSPANGVTTPTPTQPGMVNDCNGFDFVNSGDGCKAVADRNGISLEDFLSWNPDVGSGCSGLWADVYVCVGVIGGTTPPTPTTLSTSTRTGNGIATPTPTQPGMVSNCDGFHLVGSGDSCYDIADEAGIWLLEFYAWNPAVGTDCSGLWLGYYVCTSVIA